MKSKKDTSPVRSRDKVVQSLYEMELSGSEVKDILKDLSMQRKYPHFKGMLKGVIDAKDVIDETLSNFQETDKKIITRLINKLSVKEIVDIISENKKISKKEIYNYCIKIK